MAGSDISVAEQLERDADQFLTIFARKMLLYQIKLETLEKRETGAVREEMELTHCINKLKSIELACTREAASMRRQLAIKSQQFLELTRQASEWLSVKALELETHRLHNLISGLRTKEETLMKELEDSPITPINFQAVLSALVLKARALQKRFRQVSDDYHKISDSARDAIREAFTDRALRVQEGEEEAKYCRGLEEAIEDMVLLQVELELTREGAGGAEPLHEDTPAALGVQAPERRAWDDANGDITIAQTHAEVTASPELSSEKDQNEGVNCIEEIVIVSDSD